MGGDYGNQISRTRGREHRNSHLRRVARVCTKPTGCGITESDDIWNEQSEHATVDRSSRQFRFHKFLVGYE